MATKLEIENDVLKAEPFLRGYAMNLCRNRDLADDLYQETVCRAFENAHQFQLGTNLDAWLCIIMRNQLFNWKRKKNMEVYDDEADAAIESDFDSAMILERLADLMEKNLPKGWAEQLIEHVVDGKSLVQIAAETGKPVNTLKVQVHRTRQKLRKLMMEDAP